MYELLDKLIQDHKTTLIFTNTRSATERVVHHLKDKFPRNYVKLNDEGKMDEVGEVDDKSYIGAHHSSLSKEHRLNIENRLKDGKLKCVVSSTSLELGIDIGYIDLVILLGSPKSVARALQRIGRSGHKLHDVSKGRIIVLDRDDLVECSVLLKAAIEHKIDKVDIPENPLDVLAQEIFGMAVEESRSLDEVYDIVRSSYPYRNLERKDFIEVIRYLTGQYVSLEDRNVYAKIWYDESNGMIGKRGKLARVLYMTNIGTIPDESFIKVKLQGSKDDENSFIGKIDENFLERLKRGDVFVLGGNTYEFLYAQGMTAFVKGSVNRPPTVPSWSSETLPLSYDLSLEIQKFRRLMNEYMEKEASKDEIIEFINKYLYVDHYGANAIYEYFNEQYNYSIIPHDKRITIEYFTEGKKKYIIFHTLYGRRVNDVLSRVLGLVISRIQHRDVEMNINDNGFYILTEDNIQAARAFNLIKSSDLRKISEISLDKTEVLARRFRHCATRALMILRTYMGKRKSVGKQQISSRLLIGSVRRISEDFPILKEARREILEDLMDIRNAQKVVEHIEHKRVTIKEVYTDMPSPFAFNIITMGYADIMKMEDKLTFLRRMHDMVKAKISLKEGKRLTKEEKEKTKIPDSIFNYDSFWKDQEKKMNEERDEETEKLKVMAWNLKRVPFPVREHIVDIIDGKKSIREDFIEAIKTYKKEIDENWPPELKYFIFNRLIELKELDEGFLDKSEYKEKTKKKE
jgi:ATP-dependent Lhr-like helicase